MDIKSLVKVANKLDSLGLSKEADVLDRLILKLADGTTPKSPMADDAKWAAYAKRVPGGDVVRVMWVDQGAGKVLNANDSFDSFKDWLRSFMGSIGISEISAPKLAGIISTLKQAQENDTAAKRTHLDGNSVYTGVVNALAGKDERRYQEIANSLMSAQRVSNSEVKEKLPESDWSYYNSKATDPVSKNMQNFWKDASEYLDMTPSYTDFVRWYKSMGFNMNPKEAVTKMFQGAMAEAKLTDPLFEAISSNQLDELKPTIFAYLGLNIKDFTTSTPPDRLQATDALNRVK